MPGMIERVTGRFLYEFGMFGDEHLFAPGMCSIVVCSRFECGTFTNLFDWVSAVCASALESRAVRLSLVFRVVFFFICVVRSDLARAKETKWLYNSVSGFLLV